MFHLKSQYMEYMHCDQNTIDMHDYNAMPQWFDSHDMHYSIDPQCGDVINFKLVEQWDEFKSSCIGNQQQ